MNFDPSTLKEFSSNHCTARDLVEWCTGQWYDLPGFSIKRQCQKELDAIDAWHKEMDALIDRCPGLTKAA